MTCLSMKEISPLLATGQFSHVPMPGIDFTASHVSLDFISGDRFHWESTKSGKSGNWVALKKYQGKIREFG